MNFQELQQEEEILSREDEKARRLLGNLKRIDAPKDFDFRLKARIANAKAQESDSPPRLFPILRYVAPLSLVIVVLAVLAINGLYSFDDKSSVPEIVEKISQNPVEAGKMPIGSSIPEQPVVASNNVEKTNVENFDKKGNLTFVKDSELAVNPKKPKTEKRVIENDGGGSRDSALSNSKVFSQKGVTANKPNNEQQTSDNPGSLSAKEILNQIGIEAVYSDNKWKVVSVKQNSRAARSGVKQNDIVETIDENRISDKTVFPKSFSGQNVNVVRAGKKQNIKLQNE